ncbi:MAG: PAS domain S-box protein [Bacteroidetes bacterium]|nr:MAG: PAS domain S-box protein [Bacteroidota bacterium]
MKIHNTEIASENHNKIPESFLNALPLPVLVLTQELVVLFSNVRASVLFGIKPLLKGETRVEELFEPELLKILHQGVSSLIKSGESKDLDFSFQPKDTTVTNLIAKLAFIDNHSGLMLMSFRDVTPEENLKRRLERLHKTFDSFHPGKTHDSIVFRRLEEAVMQSANTIVITNPDGNIIFANPRFEETTGYTFEEAYMQNPRILKSGDQPDWYYEELWKTISSGKVWKGEFKNRNKAGGYYWESATITPIKDDEGNVLEYLAIKEEITERKKIEEKLEKTLMDMEVSNWEYKMLNQDLNHEVERRKTVESELNLQKELLQELNENLESQVDAEVKKNRQKDELMLLQSRQAAMGEMIGNIAHQWRQPLNAIGLMVYDLTDAFRFGEIDENYITKSEENITSVLQHMSGTIDDFRNFFKPNKEKQTFTLYDVVKTSVSFLDATLKNSGIRLITEIEKDVSLYGYSSEFAQVLLNIINNARDALSENHSPNPVIRISGYRKDEYACIKIIDNAGGVDPAIIHKIFDPYFTSKEQGKGTGVGLYMSKTIIERNMGGAISVNNLRNGAEFVITVPLKKSEG